MTEPRVYLHHARQVPGYRAVLCAPGIRRWCAAHGIDIRTLSREGYPLSTIQAIGDHFAQQVVTIVQQEAARG